MVIRLITHLSTITLTAGTLVVMLALSMGQALPRSQQLLFSSARNWQDWAVGVYALDLERNIAQQFFASRSDNLPGQPILWSPDGDHIAYVSDMQHLETYLVNFRDLDVSRLAASTTDSEFNAEWSPDGRWLAFVGSADRHADIYLAEADGNQARKLTNTGAGYKNLAWSPDSRWIAAEAGESNEEIVLVDTANGKITNLTRHPAKDVRPAWSLEGSQIAFLSSRENRGTGGTRFDLYILDVECLTCPARRLTDDHPADSAWSIRWSPEGDALLFASTSWTGGDDILWVNPRSGDVRNITHDEARDANPVWSPDGKRFLYESKRGGYWEIMLVEIGRQEAVSLVAGSYDKRRPIWSPDGQQIVFIANAERNWDIYLLDLREDERMTRRLTHALAIDFAPIWRPG